MTNLETILKEIRGEPKISKPRYKKVMITGDYHIPYLNNKVYNLMKNYAKQYQPDTFIINGDFLDMYSLSRFDRNPKRKTSFAQELEIGKIILKDLRKTIPNTEIIMLAGNHEKRLTKYLWNNNELFDLGVLDIQELMDLKTYKIRYIDADVDYWKETDGTLTIADTIIMHGDGRLNGASYSKNSGYSAMNTVKNNMSNICMNHTHRLAKVYVKDLVGLECGCLCNCPSSYNWKNGFATFEHYRGESVNFKTYEIKNNSLIIDGVKFKA